jgi:hypothetical protein
MEYGGKKMVGGKREENYGQFVLYGSEKRVEAVI